MTEDEAMLKYHEKLNALRAHLKEGEEQAARGEFIEDFSIEKLIAELDEE